MKGQEEKKKCKITDSPVCTCGHLRRVHVMKFSGDHGFCLEYLKKPDDIVILVLCPCMQYEPGS